MNADYVEFLCVLQIQSSIFWKMRRVRLDSRWSWNLLSDWPKRRGECWLHSDSLSLSQWCLFPKKWKPSSKVLKVIGYFTRNLTSKFNRIISVSHILTERKIVYWKPAMALFERRLSEPCTVLVLINWIPVQKPSTFGAQFFKACQFHEKTTRPNISWIFHEILWVFFVLKLDHLLKSYHHPDFGQTWGFFQKISMLTKDTTKNFRRQCLIWI